MEKLAFVKMHGAGNDYIYMDSLTDDVLKRLDEKSYPDLARKVSDVHFGIGSDGLILILPSSTSDFRMRIFNSDGSEAQMCGNGIRCVARYVYDKGLTQKNKLKIETLAGIKEVMINKTANKNISIKVDMGMPETEPTKIPINVILDKNKKGILKLSDNQEFKIHPIGMGNPHCVIFVDEITDDLINRYGPEIEHHPMFPERTNVEFVKVKKTDTIEMRVWERGSGETFACGTGACASVVASVINGHTSRNVLVKLLGGDLTINYDERSGHVYMSGGAEFIATGEYYYDTDK